MLQQWGTSAETVQVLDCWPWKCFDSLPCTKAAAKDKASARQNRCMSLFCLMTVSAFVLLPCWMLRFATVLCARNRFLLHTPPVALKYLTMVAAKQKSPPCFHDRASLRKKNANLSVAVQSTIIAAKCVYSSVLRQGTRGCGNMMPGR